MEKPIRTFVAFELPTAVIQMAADLQTDLKACKLKMRWVRPQNMHLTVKFLGDIPPHRTQDVSRAMQQAAESSAPLSLCLQGMGVFPGMRKPRVVWIGLGGQTEELAKLHAGLEDELAGLGFQRENRPFRAHLTLARLDRPVEPQQLLQHIQAASRYEPIAFQAAELILFQSDLRPQGPIYTPLARVALDR